jgi:hypothetical protein
MILRMRVPIVSVWVLIIHPTDPTYHSFTSLQPDPDSYQAQPEHLCYTAVCKRGYLWVVRQQPQHSLKVLCISMFSLESFLCFSFMH